MMPQDAKGAFLHRVPNQRRGISARWGCNPAQNVENGLHRGASSDDPSIGARVWPRQHPPMAGGVLERKRRSKPRNRTAAGDRLRPPRTRWQADRERGRPWGTGAGTRCAAAQRQVLGMAARPVHCVCAAPVVPRRSAASVELDATSIRLAFGAVSSVARKRCGPRTGLPPSAASMRAPADRERRAHAMHAPRRQNAPPSMATLSIAPCPSPLDITVMPVVPSASINSNGSPLSGRLRNTTAPMPLEE